MSALDVLFEPFKIGSLTVKNRVVMAPMTRSMSPQGVPGEDVAAYYRRRAEGQVGLILSEASVIDRPGSRNDPNVPSFHGDAALAGWKRLIDGVHLAGGKMGPQLWHVGAVQDTDVDWVSPVIESPSGLMAPAMPRGEAMTDAAIADTIASFARAAFEAKRLGFDTLEVHGGHGYLVDQFFWAGTNKRTDRFGGATIGERVTFAVEALKAVRSAVGPDFPIILRVSQWKPQDYDARIADNPNAMAAWLCPLVEAGADILHCSQRRFWQPEFAEIDGDDGLNFAGWAKKLTGAATISVGSVGLSGDAASAARGESSTPVGLERLTARLERNEFDLIAVGRALLSDPDWAVKTKDGRDASLHGFTPAAMGTLS